LKKEAKTFATLSRTQRRVGDSVQKFFGSFFQKRTACLRCFVLILVVRSHPRSAARQHHERRHIVTKPGHGWPKILIAPAALTRRALRAGIGQGYPGLWLDTRLRLGLAGGLAAGGRFLALTRLVLGLAGFRLLGLRLVLAGLGAAALATGVAAAATPLAAIAFRPFNDVQAGHGNARYGAARQFLDRFYGQAVIRAGQRIGVAFAAGAAGAADAVHVVLGMMRHVEIEHVAQPADVDAAGRDVATDQQAKFAGLELFQRGEARRLRQVAMQGADREAVPGQRFVEDVHFRFAIAEDQRALHLLAAD